MKVKLLVKTTLRSFFIQSSMNFERMHNIGIAYILLPTLKVLYKNDEEKLKDSLKRHLEFYNCQPYMSSFILGVTLKLEEKLAHGEIDNPQMITQIKSGMMGPFAAMGDSLFWKTLRPLIAVIAVTFALQGYSYAPLVFLTLYNLPHLAIRFFGLKFGYKEDIKIIKRVQAFDISKMINFLGIIGLLFTGILLNNLAFWEISNLIPISQLVILSTSIMALKKGLKPLPILILIMGAAFIVKLFT